MKTLLLLVVIMALGLLQVQGSLLDFRKMIRLVTGKEATSSYGFYGCHCGVGGKGSPKDATDRCCAEHDCCYKRLEKRRCGTKFLNYKFTKSGSQIVCGKTQFYDPTRFPYSVSTVLSTGLGTRCRNTEGYCPCLKGS
nr:phospholipase A2, membrane associated-like [Loxodonta africana]